MNETSDHDRIIRIDERTEKMNDRIYEMHMQIKEESGRTTELEKYRAIHEQMTTEKVQQLDDHEERMNKIEDQHREWKGSWKIILLIAMGSAFIVETAFRFFVK